MWELALGCYALVGLIVGALAAALCSYESLATLPGVRMVVVSSNAATANYYFLTHYDSAPQSRTVRNRALSFLYGLVLWPVGIAIALFDLFLYAVSRGVEEEE